MLGLLGQKQLIKTNDKGKKRIVSKCISSQKIRNFTYTHYGSEYIRRYYQIKSGDTLLSISHKVGLDTKVILKLNPGGYPGSLKTKSLLLSECFAVTS